MARFDVYRQPGGDHYLLDCQSDALANLNTRFVVPLLPPGYGPLPIQRLNPAFRVGHEEVVMYTQFAGAVPLRELQAAIASLAEEDRSIMNALDMLISGY